MIDLSLLQEFIAETGEHLEEMETNLLQLEADPNNRDVLNDIFRSAHTIKGSAEYLGMEKIGELSHKLENLLEILRHGDHSLDKELIDTLIESKDRIALLNEDLQRSQSEEREVGDLTRRIDALVARSVSPEFMKRKNLHRLRIQIQRNCLLILRSENYQPQNRLKPKMKKNHIKKSMTMNYLKFLFSICRRISLLFKIR